MESVFFYTLFVLNFDVIFIANEVDEATKYHILCFLFGFASFWDFVAANVFFSFWLVFYVVIYPLELVHYGYSQHYKYILSTTLHITFFKHLPTFVVWTNQIFVLILITFSTNFLNNYTSIISMDFDIHE